MEPVNLFNVASQQAQWLAVRQTAVSSNIANANTPGYGAVDVEPFEAILNQKTIAMRATHPRHVSTAGTPEAMAVRQVDDDQAVLPSGNSVVLEKELMKGGEVMRSFQLNTAIVKSFHRMLMTTTRS